MSNLVVIEENLHKASGEFQKILPPSVPVDKFLRIALTTIKMNSGIARCTPKSIIASCMKAAQDDLLMDGREAAMVVYKDQAQYMPMIAGLLKKVRNSGQVSAIAAHLVYENDFFEVQLGDTEEIKHNPQVFGDRGKLVGGYAIATMKDGEKIREVMSLDEINKVKNVSRAKNSGPWVDWFEEMAKKTILRRLIKRLPLSTDIQSVLEHDNQHYQLEKDITPRRPADFAAKDAAQDLFLDFEGEHLQAMQEAAMSGMDELQEAFQALPAGPAKQQFWQKHKPALIAAAESAQYAESKQGSTVDMQTGEIVEGHDRGQD